MKHSVDVSGNSVCLVFTGQADHEEYLTLEDRTDRLHRNVGN